MKDYDYLPEILKKFLKILKDEAEQLGIEFMYYFIKNLLEYYSTCYVKNEDIAIFDIDIPMTDLGDELFDMVYGVEKKIYGNTELINDHMKMSPIGNSSNDIGQVKNASGRYEFKAIGSNTNKMNFHWIVLFSKMKI